MRVQLIGFGPRRTTRDYTPGAETIKCPNDCFKKLFSLTFLEDCEGVLCPDALPHCCDDDDDKRNKRWVSGFNFAEAEGGWGGNYRCRRGGIAVGGRKKRI